MVSFPDLLPKQGHLTSTPHSNDRPSVIHSATPKTGEGMRKLETNEEQDSGISGSAFTFPDDEIDEASRVELSTHSFPRVGGLFHSDLKQLTEGVLAAKNKVASNPDIGEGGESIPIEVSDCDQHSVSDTHNPGADASAHLMIVGGSSEPLSPQKNPYFKKAAEGLMDLMEAGSAIAEKNKQIADLQSNFEKLKNEKEDVEFAMKSGELQFERIRQQKDGEIKELKYQLQKRDGDLDRYKNKVAAREQEIKALKEKNQEESQLMKQKHEKEIKGLKQNVKAAEQQKEKVETELAKKETEYKELELKHEREVHRLEMQLQSIQSNMKIQNFQKDTELAQEREKLAQEREKNAKMELKCHHSESSAAIAAKDAQIKQLEEKMAGMKANDTHN